MKPTSQQEPHVVIVGCGFAGLEAAKAFKNQPVRVTLLDRNNHHLFQPLLYQVATAGLSAPAIAEPIRHIFRHQANVTVLMKEVQSIDPDSKRLACSDGEVFVYDVLLLAAGAKHSYFGHDAWEKHALGLKTLNDAMAIRRRLLLAFEAAENAAKNTEQTLNFIVIGAGPTGVEMAGTMAEIARHTLRGEFRRIDPTKARVILLEGGGRVLPSYTEAMSAKALYQLQHLGVEVRLNAQVTHVDDLGVVIGNLTGERLVSPCVVWAAGVQASPLAKQLGVPLDRAGRVFIDADLHAKGLDDVYVLGDMAAGLSEGKPVPSVSPAAKQMGQLAAQNVLAKLSGLPLKNFVYKDYGALATIGRRSAVVDLGFARFSGFFAWLFWLFIHVYFLIGFRSRLMVLTEWAWSYFTFDRSARIIIDIGRSEIKPGPAELP